MGKIWWEKPFFADSNNHWTIKWGDAQQGAAAENALFLAVLCCFFVPLPNDRYRCTKTGSGHACERNAEKREAFFRRRPAHCLRWRATEAGKKNGALFAMPFYSKHDHFTKTGSGQT
jgi:hypothetical protein